MKHARIYKILTRGQWLEAQDQGVFKGAPIDIADGYIHFSTAGQAKETAARHFAGQEDLLLACVETAPLGEHLVYEISRGGQLFPHLYAPLELSQIAWVKPLPLRRDGAHIFPELDE